MIEYIVAHPVISMFTGLAVSAAGSYYTAERDYDRSLIACMVGIGICFWGLIGYGVYQMLQSDSAFLFLAAILIVVVPCALFGWGFLSAISNPNRKNLAKTQVTVNLGIIVSLVLAVAAGIAYLVH